MLYFRVNKKKKEEGLWGLGRVNEDPGKAGESE